MGKKKTHEEFIDELKIKNPIAYNELKFIDEYKNNSTKIRAFNKYGIVKITPNSLLMGHAASIQSAINKNEYFANQAKKIHSDKYDYSLVRYINGSIKIKIRCFIHGVFEQKPYLHLNGRGCCECGAINRSKKRRMTKEEFVKRSALIHNGKYNYDNVVYKNSNTKVEIICSNPFHGPFFQTPSHHLKNHGCPKCIGHYEIRYGKYNIPTYETHNRKLTSIGVDCRRDPSDGNILQVKCHLCREWFTPTTYQVTGKCDAAKYFGEGECNLYCSDDCKNNCSTFNRKMLFSWQTPINKHSDYYDNSSLTIWANEVKKLSNCCEKCGSKDRLVAHHEQPKTLFPEKALWVSNGIVLCHECHIKAHHLGGCGFHELRKCKI